MVVIVYVQSMHGGQYWLLDYSLIVVSLVLIVPAYRLQRLAEKRRMSEEYTLSE